MKQEIRIEEFIPIVNEKKKKNKEMVRYPSDESSGEFLLLNCNIK